MNGRHHYSIQAIKKTVTKDLKLILRWTEPFVINRVTENAVLLQKGPTVKIIKSIFIYF